MTIPRLEAMTAYWGVHPPLAFRVEEIAVMVKAYFGIKENRKAKQNKDLTEEEKEAEWLKQFEQLGQLMQGQ